VIRKDWYSSLNVQVLFAILVGILIGHYFPKTGIALKPLGDAFISLIQMMIGPVIFGVLVQGIASMTNMQKLGRIGLKTLVYFAVVSAITLTIGMLAANIGHPGIGLQASLSATGFQSAGPGVPKAADTSLGSWLIELVPRTFVGAFLHQNVLQIVLLALLTGFSIAGMGELGKKAEHVVGLMTKVSFGIIRFIIRLAPIGAFGAIAFTVGQYDLKSLTNLAKLVVVFYAACAGFVVLVLAMISWLSGFSLLRFLIYIKEELLIVLGTSSSETAIPDMILKLERLGVPGATAGLVFPMGYSFNNAGANIFITLSVFFLAQANGISFTPGQELRILLFALVASTGGAGVPGGALVRVAVVLSSIPAIPAASLALLLGVDKLLSECRALANVIGNGVATIAISRWEGELGAEELRQGLRGETT